MPIIEIDGLGRVEVDDSFLSMSEADQDATVRQIISQTGQSPQQARPKPSPQSPHSSSSQPPQAPVQPDFAAPENVGGFGAGGTLPDIDTNGDGYYSDEEYAAAEADYQASADAPPAIQPDFADQSSGKSLEGLVNPKAEEKDEIPFYKSAAMGFGQGLTFNYLDEIGAGVNALIPGKDSVWDTGSFSQSYDTLVDRYRKFDEQAASEDPVSYYGGNIAGSVVVPGGAARGALKGLTGTAKALKAAKEAAIGGAIAGSGIGEGGPLERLDEAAFGAAAGATVGALASGLGTAISRDRRIQAWVSKELDKNPYARVDAEIVSDLVAARERTARSVRDPKGRAQLTAKEINSVERSYSSQVAGMLQQLDLPPSEKSKLIAALEIKYTVPRETLDALRGTVEGDAVADVIIRTQRLRALTPEIKTGMGPALTRLTELASGAAGAAAAGPFGSPLASIAARKVTGAGSNEAARVNAADRLLKRADFYRALGDRAGPSELAGSRDTLLKAYNTIVDQAANRKAIATYQREAAKSDRELFQSIRSPTVDDRDLQAPLQKIERDALKADAKDTVAEGASALARFNQRLKEEGIAPSSRTAADPVREAVEANIAAGVKGDSRTQQAIADRLGVPVSDMLRALDGIRGRFPALSGEIDRIAANYPTTNRNAGSALIPAMRKVLEDDGTLTRVAKQAEEAQAKASARAKLMAGEALPSVGAKLTKAELDDYAQFFRSQAADREDGMVGFVGGFGGRSDDDAAIFDYLKAKGYGPYIRGEADELPRPVSATPEPQMRGIDRPDQWAQGRSRYQAQAQDAIDTLLGDGELPDEAFKLIGNAPSAIRDSYRTTEDAMTFIDEQVLPDLQMEGISPAAIGRVRQHLISIARAKPYATRAEYEAGTKPR